MEIKAIETSYAGHRFRSRLEARWAVFFDAFGVRWMYEPQGYETAQGRYLPDFWLPDLCVWVEVKGTFDQAGWDRLCAAMWHLPAVPDELPSAFKRETPLLLVLGEIPSSDDADTAYHYLLQWGIDEVKRPAVVAGQATFVASDYLLPFGDLVYPDRLSDTSIVLRSSGSWVIRPSEKLAAAYERARRARFEHGESG